MSNNFVFVIWIIRLFSHIQVTEIVPILAPFRVSAAVSPSLISLQCSQQYTISNHTPLTRKCLLPLPSGTIFSLLMLFLHIILLSGLTFCPLPAYANFDNILPLQLCVQTYIHKLLLKPTNLPLTTFSEYCDSV